MSNRQRLPNLLIMAGVMGAATGAGAQTAEWRRLGQDGPFEIAVDIGSFTGPRTERVARTLLAPMEEGAAGPYMVLHVRIDCEARTISAVDAIAYDARGSVLGEGPLDPDTTAVEESEGSARLARAACDGAEIDSPTFDSAAAFAAWAATQVAKP